MHLKSFARTAPLLVTLLGTLLGTLTGCVEQGVVRVVEGQEIEGRFISDQAYAHYARAAIAEAAGNVNEAIASLEQAAREDPESVAIWTRLGALRCLTTAQVELAKQSFSRAYELDPNFAPLFLEKARCEIRAGNPGQALADAQRSASLDPDEVEATALYAELLRRSGRTTEARRALEAFVTRAPLSVGGWEALYTHGQAVADAALVERAGRRLEELAPDRFAKLGVQVPALDPLARIDEALGREDETEARRLARRAHLPLAELALRAAALGQIKLAEREAELVLGADPMSSSARIALAVAADLGGDLETLAQTMATIPEGAATRLTPPSPLARLLFAELLYRRVGATAARAWLGGRGLSGSGEAMRDPLLEKVGKRVEQRLGERETATKLAR